jgi:hypothetical protein
MTVRIRAQRQLLPISVPFLEETKPTTNLLEQLAQPVDLSKASMVAPDPVINPYKSVSNPETTQIAPAVSMNPIWHKMLTDINDSIQDPNFSWINCCDMATTAIVTDEFANIGTYNNGDNGVGATITFPGEISPIDLRSVAAGDRVLVRNQTDSTWNGIYIVSDSLKVLYRDTNYDGSSLGKIKKGSTIYVKNGHQNATAFFTQESFDSDEGDIVGTDSIDFSPTASQVYFTGTSVPAGTDYLVNGRFAAVLNGTASAYTIYLANATNGTNWLPINAAPTGTAGGDLSGTYPNPTVSRIEGVDVSVTNATAVSNLTGVNSGDQSLFRTIAVSGQSDIVADSATDTLTVVAGSNITLTTDAATDTLTIAASGAAVSDADYGDITVSGSGATWTIDNDAVTYAKIQNVTDARLLGRSAGSNGDCQEITVGTGLSLAAGALTSTITQYTDELAEDAVGGILTDTATIDFTYNDVANTITADVKAASITEAMQVLADNTTNNASTSAHGYLKKLSNVSTEFMNGQGNWATPTAVTSVATSGLATGGTITSTGTITVTAAVKADQETATSTAVAVVPAVQQSHPSAAKVWAQIVYSAGTPSAITSYNVSSITDTAVGQATVNFTTSFSSTNYCAAAEKTATPALSPALATNKATGSVRVEQRDDAGTFADIDGSLICFGDQ